MLELIRAAQKPDDPITVFTLISEVQRETENWKRQSKLAEEAASKAEEAARAEREAGKKAAKQLEEMRIANEKLAKSLEVYEMNQQKAS